MTSLTPQHISLSLRAICYGHPLPTTPLFRLECIPFEMYDHISSEIAMSDWLVSLICTQLNYQLAIHQLERLTSQTPKPATKSTLVTAFTLNASYLQAWAILYARVVRTDLNFTMTELADITSTHPRTLRRRQQLGIHCLYAHIVRLERDCNKQ